jgi:hypothetical protein
MVVIGCASVHLALLDCPFCQAISFDNDSDLAGGVCGVDADQHCVVGAVSSFDQRISLYGVFAQFVKSVVGIGVFLQLVVAVVMTVFGIKLANEAQSSGKLSADSRNGVIRLYFLLGVLVLLNLVRVVVGLYYSIAWVNAVGP